LSRTRSDAIQIARKVAHVDFSYMEARDISAVVLAGAEKRKRFDGLASQRQSSTSRTERR